MWYCPEKYEKEVVNVNDELLQIKGSLDETDAKITLAKFLRYNISFTTELLSGIQLEAFQEMAIRGFFNRNFSMCVLSRGAGKSFLAAVYCFLHCIFNPGSKILIAGPTFRTARNIFNELERIVNSKNAKLLQQCFCKEPSKRPDVCEWEINEGIIRAIPLNGEKIRGFRANILLLDEFLLLPEDIVKTVLMPFLASPHGLAERIKIRRMEDDLIKKGVLKESQRIQFENTSKMIVFSSASYTFENLYKVYRSWIDKIKMTPEEEIEILKQEMPDMLAQGVPKYFILQMGYDALPAHMVDPTVVQEAQSGGNNDASFQREYRAQFVDGSDSYYSAKKMMECTIPVGVETTLEIVGEKGAKYIIAIDPSFSDASTSDHFAMNVLKLDDETKKPTLVHNYAVAGGNIKDHHKYFFYLLKNFNPEMIIIDNAGWEFINSANESSLFKLNRKEIQFFDFDSTLEGEEYIKHLKEVRNAYNKEAGVIAFKQFSSSDYIRRANENLKGMIDYKKIFFGSLITPNESKFSSIINACGGEGWPDLKLTQFENLTEFIDFQDDWINQVKKQCALIDIKISPQGHQTFDLPSHLKNRKSSERARKDSYTTLVLAAWAHKCYYDIMNMNIEEEDSTFEPFFI